MGTISAWLAGHRRLVVAAVAATAFAGGMGTVLAFSQAQRLADPAPTTVAPTTVAPLSSTAPVTTTPTTTPSAMPADASTVDHPVTTLVLVRTESSRPTRTTTAQRMTQQPPDTPQTHTTTARPVRPTTTKTTPPPERCPEGDYSADCADDGLRNGSA